MHKLVPEGKELARCRPVAVLQATFLVYSTSVLIAKTIYINVDSVKIWTLGGQMTSVFELVFPTYT